MNFYRSCTLSLLAVIGLACPSPDAKEARATEERPNILWIVSEDNSPWLGCYGDTLATTPNLDRLAGEGLRYTRAYSNAPVCAPSRYALITGTYAIGYGTEHMRSGHRIPDSVHFYPQLLREAGYYTSNNVKKDYNTVDRPGAWDESSKTAHYRNRPAGKPFFQIFNLTISHESKLHRDSLARHHDPEAVKVYPYHPNTPEARNDYAVYYDRLQDMDTEVGEILDELEQEGLADNTIVFYYADHGGAVAGTKRFVTEDGLRVPMLLRVPSRYRDRLDGLPLVGTVDRPVSFVDLTYTALELAGARRPAYLDGSSLLSDRGPAFAFAYGGRMDERRNLVRSVTNGRYRLTRNYLPHRPYGRRLETLYKAPLMQSWRKAYDAGRLDSVQSAFFEPRPAVELYDIEKDPHQTRNLTSDSTFANVKERLDVALTDWQRHQPDAGLIPEALLLELDKKGIIRHQLMASDYPVGRGPFEGETDLVALAQLAGERDFANLITFMLELNNPNPEVAYWAATGLLLLGDRAGTVRSTLLTALEEVHPIVGIVLAEALMNIGERNRALDYLTGVLEHDNLMVRLAAMETIVELAVQDRRLVAAARELIPADPQARPYDGRLARYVVKRFATD